MMKTKMQVKKSSKPFCKVCFDTGKSEQEYRSHYVKNIPGPNGVVVCPTILSVECRYCKSIGHTVSKCPSLKLKSDSYHDKNPKSNRTIDNHPQTKTNNTPSSTTNTEIEKEEDTDKSMDICPENSKYEVSYANMVLKPPTIIPMMAMVNEKEKEKKEPKVLSIIDPSSLENNNSVQNMNKSYTPPYPPPSFRPRLNHDRPVSKTHGFKPKQIVIRRWADDVEADTSDCE